MLPEDHEIVYAKVSWISQRLEWGDVPRINIMFSEQGDKLSLEELIEKIPEYPKNVSLVGNALHQNHEFLRMFLTDLVNRGHEVIVMDTGDRRIDWKLVGPKVHWHLAADILPDNYKRLDEDDAVVFEVSDIDRYLKRRNEIQILQIQGFKNQFWLKSNIEDLPKWVLEDHLEVSII